MPSREAIVLALTGLLGAASSGSGSSISFLLPLLLIGGLYFLMIRPQQRRTQKQKQLADNLDPGDEVVTHGGMYGTITEIDDDEGTILLEVAPNVEIRMLKQSVARRLVLDDGPAGDDTGASDGSPALGDGAKPSADKEAGDQR
jgi:preprotein translocase subunit YajC